MKLHGDFSKEASAEHYKKKIKQIKSQNRILGFICNTAILIMVICMFLCLVNVYVEKKSHSHSKVTTKMLTVKEKEIAKDQYTQKIKESYVKGGKTYYDVTIGKYTTERSSDEIRVFGQDTVCDTEVYILNIRNTDPFFLSATIPRDITIVRYSILGENPFTKAEIENYKKQAAQYFTYQKYRRLNFPDADKYKITIRGMAKKNEILSQLEEKF